MEPPQTAEPVESSPGTKRTKPVPVATRDRLREKLRQRKAEKGETIIEHDEQDEHHDAEGGIAPEDTAKHPKFIKMTFDVTVHLLDRDALLRIDASEHGLKLYDTLCQDCRKLSDSPTWHLTVPALSRDMSIGKPAKRELDISCVDVMLKSTTELPSEQRLPKSDDAPALDKVVDYSPLRRTDDGKVYAVRMSVWTVEDPNKEQREAHAVLHPTVSVSESNDTTTTTTAAPITTDQNIDKSAKQDKKNGETTEKTRTEDYVPQFSAEPFSLECSMDTYATAKPCRVCERFTTDNDPAELATSWTWSEGENEFDLDGHIPVRATAVACQLLNPTLLSNRGATQRLTRKNHRMPYYVEQKGVGICRSKHILGKHATLPDELVAVIHERHCVAQAIMRAPARAGAKRLVSMALGSLIAGTVTRGDKEELACALTAQPRVLVVPYTVYVESMKNLRWDALSNLDNMVPMGKVSLRVAKEHDNGQQRRINIVTTYVKFESCPSLLLRQGISSLGDGWIAVILKVGQKTIVGHSDTWDKRAIELHEFCASLLKDQEFDALDIDESTGVVNLDSLSDVLEQRIAATK